MTNATRLLIPLFETIVCPWTVENPRHDHRLLFPLRDGRLMLVWSEYHVNWPRTPLTAALAKDEGETWTTQAGGGQLVDTGSHTVAALLYVVQMDPVEVFAFVDNCGLDVDVNTAMVVRFAQGAQATITVGGFGHSVTESIRVVGDDASARLFFRTVKEQSLEVNGEDIDAKSLTPASNPNANFLDAVLGNGEIGADGLLGLRVAQLSEAAYRSAAEGRPARVEA